LPTTKAMKSEHATGVLGPHGAAAPVCIGLADGLSE
jgi:hypothetical protein